MNTFLQSVKYGASRWPSPGFLSVLHNPRRHQQLPQHIGEPRGWSVWPCPSHDFENDCLIMSDIGERDTSCQNLPGGEFSTFNRKECALTSMIVIPIAYISVSLEGSCFISLLVNPNMSGNNNSGAIHRVVPFKLPSATVVLLVVSSIIAASPKSAKRARHSESTRMLTLWNNSVSSLIVQLVNQELTPLRSPCTILCSCRYSNPVTAPTSCPDG